MIQEKKISYDAQRGCKRLFDFETSSKEDTADNKDTKG